MFLPSEEQQRDGTPHASNGLGVEGRGGKGSYHYTLVVAKETKCSLFAHSCFHLSKGFEGRWWCHMYSCIINALNYPSRSFVLPSTSTVVPSSHHSLYFPCDALASCKQSRTGSYGYLTLEGPPSSVALIAFELAGAHGQVTATTPQKKLKKKYKRPESPTFDIRNHPAHTPSHDMLFKHGDLFA